MESGDISDNQLSAASVFETPGNEGWQAHLARLNREGTVNGWMPIHDDKKQYIEVRSKKYHEVSCCCPCFTLNFIDKYCVLLFFNRRFKMQGSNSTEGKNIRNNTK